MSHVCSGKKKFNLSPVLYPDINYSSEVNRVKRLFLKEIDCKHSGPNNEDKGVNLSTVLNKIN